MKNAKYYGDRFDKFNKAFDRMLDRIDAERKREHEAERGKKSCK
jgi:hypothetical protein